MMMYGVSYFRNKMHHLKAIPKKISHSCSSLRPLVSAPLHIEPQIKFSATAELIIKC